MTLKNLTMEELIDLCERRGESSGLSDYTDCYNEMLRRLKECKGK